MSVFSEFQKTLEEAIRSDTSGHFQRLLISLSQVPSSPQDIREGIGRGIWGEVVGERDWDQNTDK